MKNKLVRITTVPVSLEKLLSGQLQFMGAHYEVIAVSSGKEHLEEIGESEGCAIFPLEMTRQITPLKDAMAVMKLYFFLKKTKPFIVHTHTPKAGIVGMLAARLAAVPVRLHTVAGLPLLEASGMKRKVLDVVEKLTYRCATRVYPNSYGLLEIIRKHRFCPDSRLKVIANGSSNGIDTAYFDPALFSDRQKQALKAELHIDSNHFVFIFVGRLVKDKGINELIAAFVELQKTRPETTLLLVGSPEDNLDPLLPETLENIHQNKDIITTGFRNDVRPYFAISDALVFPSYREGFPNAVLQAGAMELPAIVSNINGCNEIITHDENGWIVPSKDQKSLFEALQLLAGDTERVQRYRQKSREKIKSRYERQLIWEALLEEYRTFDN